MSGLVTNAIVKGTFVLLLLGSFVTWALVIVKGFQRWRARRADARFFRVAKGVFRRASLEALPAQDGPTWRVTAAGLAALREGREPDTDEPASPREAIERALEHQIHVERRAAESGLAVLASIGTTAPFVGLFGTVWGIIHALKAIGHSGSASLEVVAAPIGEALVATGLGIAVASPAVLAYNFFLRRLKVQSADFEQYGVKLLASLFRGSKPGHLHHLLPHDSHEADLREASL